MPHRNPAVPQQLVPIDDVDLYARALAIGAQPRKTSVLERTMNAIYWTLMLLAAGWVVALAYDRDPPIQWEERRLVNAGGKVEQGERILIQARRRRTRICELVKRQSMVDGGGRRIDFEPERFDAYGDVTPPGKPETDITGPYVPLDAMPGRGRLYTTFAWDCNVLQRAIGWSIVQVQGPIEFEIVKRAD